MRWHSTVFKLEGRLTDQHPILLSRYAQHAACEDLFRGSPHIPTKVAITYSGIAIHEHEVKKQNIISH